MSARLFDMTAVELHDAFREHRLTPVEVCEAVLERIEACEGKLNAMHKVDREGARRAARESETRWRNNQPLSPLDGVPITIKDNIKTRGFPTALGTAAFADAPVADDDAPPAQRVREAGCVILGKTTMPDFGMLSSGLSSLHGITRNPWDLSCNTWGSSAGAAAGVAAGYAPLALGTDIGGSVRLPAAACGHVALKPSQGRVPVHPPYLGRVTGPMTRTAREATLLLTVLKRPDDRDYMSLPPDDRDYAAELDHFDLRGVRIGLLLDIGIGLKVSEEVRQAVRHAADRLQAEGAVIEEMEPFATPEMLDGFDRFFRARLFTDTQAITAVRRTKILPFIRQWSEKALGWSAADLMRALNQIFAVRERAIEVTKRFDFVISPTAPIAGFPADDPCPGNDPARPFDHVCFTAPFNQSEQPASSINCGYTAAGLPIGLQIVGRRFDDLGVLKLTQVYERLRGPIESWPEPGQPSPARARPAPPPAPPAPPAEEPMIEHVAADHEHGPRPA